ncbi:hypothetical protein [Phycicoccus sp. Root101]|uniref:hypothetical protein n=1 Tax=Phycicoccus sp. Root101 TaxID=1736421 RepID=UPI0007039C9D|nr:hypothetical protein [Phycicoccus sp. Root101]KQU67357.1 hypothetical protein ASC58_12270 [Phycicoccus sp. Root101]
MTSLTTYPAPPRSAVSVEELQRAWQAVQAGDFRRHPGASPRPDASSSHETGGQPWEPHEAVLPVIGCAGSVGATTLALSLATAAVAATADAVGGARVVECCTVTASGLAPASTAELGQHPAGWLQGTRGEVLLERSTDMYVSPDEVLPPTDAAPGLGLTVLDVGWELGQLMASPSWLSDRVLHADHVVAVTTATIPGLRRLEGALALLEGTPVIGAVLGPPRRKWPRGLEHSLGALSRRLDQHGAMHPIPLDRGLAVRGLDSQALPTRLLTAAGHLLRASVAGATTKGNLS